MILKDHSLVKSFDAYNTPEQHFLHNFQAQSGKCILYTSVYSEKYSSDGFRLMNSRFDTIEWITSLHEKGLESREPGRWESLRNQGWGEWFQGFFLVLRQTLLVVGQMVRVDRLYWSRLSDNDLVGVHDWLNCLGCSCWVTPIVWVKKITEEN